MKNLTKVYAQVSKWSRATISLNHDRTRPADQSQVIRCGVRREFLPNQLAFNRFLALYIMDESEALANDNVYLDIRKNGMVDDHYDISLLIYPDVTLGLALVFKKMDWRMLRKQKQKLVKLIWDNSKSKLWGIVHLIDHIQDTAADTGYVSEKKSLAKDHLKKNNS